MGSVARNDGSQHPMFLRKDLTYADNGVVKTIGVIPANSIIKKTSFVHVSTVFNAGTNNFMDVGNTTTGDLYGTDLSLLALGPVPLDEAVSFLTSTTADTTITATIQLSGTAATTGAVQVVIEYIPPN